MQPPLPFASDDSPAIKPPRLPGRLVLRKSADDAIDAVLADLFMQAMSCIGAFGDFHFAVCPTKEAEPVLRRMLFDLSLRSFPWQKTRLWLTDELVTEESDPARRGTALHDLLVAQSGIPEEQVHLIQAWKPDADAAYETQLRDVLGWREKGHDRLDAVFLTMDTQGSIAGLRPGSASLSATDRLVILEDCSGDIPDSITMSLPLLNASRVVTVLATGPGVQGTLRRIEIGHRNGESATSPIPAARLSPVGGELRWYLDQESLSPAVPPASA